jgi:hypothetical protein
VGRGSVRARRSPRPSRGSVDSCGRQDDRLQLICIPFGRSPGIKAATALREGSISIRSWSLGRVALLSSAWVATVLLVKPWPRGDTIQGFDEHGQVFLSASSPAEPAEFLELGSWAVLPPLVLFTVWRLQKRSQSN